MNVIYKVASRSPVYARQHGQITQINSRNSNQTRRTRPIAPDTRPRTAGPVNPARAEAPELEPDDDELEPEEAAADAVLAGTAVAMAPTPPVTGPLSVSYMPL